MRSGPLKITSAAIDGLLNQLIISIDIDTDQPIATYQRKSMTSS